MVGKSMVQTPGASGKLGIKAQGQKRLSASSKTLLFDLRTLIEGTRDRVSRQVNEELVLLYWTIGKKIRENVLKTKRATYGERIVALLGKHLGAEYGRGFSARNLASMIRFAEVYPDPEILHALSAKLSWTHLRQIIYIEDSLKRDFYAEMCRLEGWSTRVLQEKIQGMLFERTAISKKPEETIRHAISTLRTENKLSPDLVFRDPYLLDFLGLNDRYIEKDLEDAIVREIEQFILELGVGFTFVARQKRITIDNDDHYLDLLFFHRGMRRLVAVELKLGDFQASDKGQMELYLRWLGKHDVHSGEEPPIGLILCAGAKRETIELMELEKSGIRVASYWLKILPKELLEKKLHEAIKAARQRGPEGLEGPEG